jgi:hypothetical protein
VIEAANTYRNDVDKLHKGHQRSPSFLFVCDGSGFEVVNLLTAPQRPTTGSHHTTKIPLSGCGFVVVQILVP